MTRPEFSTYLFDLDGTLIDSTDLIMAAYRHTMQTHLGAVPDEDAWRAGFGRPLRTQLARFARTRAEVDAMTATYADYSDRHHDAMVGPYPAIRDVLAALRRPGLRFGVVTSKNRRSTARGLAVCRLEGFFDVCVTVDDVVESKPHPAPVRAALERLAAASGDTVFIGDSPHDVAAGRAAGVSTAAALWGPCRRAQLAEARPDHWLTHPREILQLGAAAELTT